MRSCKAVLTGAALMLLTATLPSAPAHAARPNNDAVPTGPSRVELDDRLIKGQTQSTGSVYIFERQKVELQSMVRKIRSFRDRILRTVFEE